MPKSNIKRRATVKKGRGVIDSVGKLAKRTIGTVVNKAVDLLPVELHVPGYQYCGPGTKLEERIKRGDKGINKLDAACKEHDIAYSKYSDSTNRAIADRKLADQAWERVKASDSSVGEKAAAWAVTNMMKIKNKIGGGKRKPLKRMVNKIKHVKKSGKGLYLKPYPKKVGSGLKKKKKQRPRRQ